MSSHESYVSSLPLSSNPQKLFLVDQPSLLIGHQFILTPCIQQEHQDRPRQEEQRVLLLFSKRSVQQLAEKTDSLGHHPISTNFTLKEYQATMSPNSAPHRKEFSADEQLWAAPAYTNEPERLPAQYGICPNNGGLDRTYVSTMTSGAATTMSSESSSSTSMYSISTEGSMNVAYTPESTYGQYRGSGSEIPFLPAESSPNQTLSESSGLFYLKCACGKLIRHRRNVKRHEQTCKLTQNKKKYPCDLCGEVFAREDIRDRHRNGDSKRDRTCYPQSSGSEVCFSSISYFTILLKHLLTIISAR